MTHVVSGKVVDIGLGEHGVVLKLALAERRSVAGNDDQLGLSRTEGLEGRLVTKSDCFPNVRWCEMCTRRGRAPLPDFITSARRELMLSVVFLVFFGAIVALYVIE